MLDSKNLGLIFNSVNLTNISDSKYLGFVVMQSHYSGSLTNILNPKYLSLIVNQAQGTMSLTDFPDSKDLSLLCNPTIVYYESDRLSRPKKFEFGSQSQIQDIMDLTNIPDPKGLGLADCQTLHGVTLLTRFDFDLTFNQV
uniref:Uncharacterized protein n=1 Tax=Salix viminalis TaxID=40686 RepID=A0A6N2MCP1_SALVM